jgi:Mn-dependent DtxR family transcriptional regulator
VSPTVQTTVEAVEALTRNGEAVTAKAVADRLKIDKSNATRRLRKAADDGYLINLEDKVGKPARWIVGDPLPTSADLLPDAAQLATPDTTDKQG